MNSFATHRTTDKPGATNIGLMNSLNNKPGLHRLVQVFKVWNRQARGLRYHHQIDPGAQSGPGAQSESCWSVINVHGCRMYGVKNEGLEKEKPVRIASRMLGAKLIELYFRLHDRGVPWRLFFQLCSRGEMKDSAQ